MNTFKAEDLKVGDVVRVYTSHNRIYTHTITRVGFKAKFAQDEEGNGGVECDAYEFESEGKKYTNRCYTLYSDHYDIIRDGVQIFG